MYMPLVLLTLCVISYIHSYSHTCTADIITHRDSMAINLIMSTVLVLSNIPVV